jgi:hypothetical protein
MADSELVYSVESVELSVIKTLPPQLAITAHGTARTPGYTDPKLVGVIYKQPPPDGIYEFSFSATPPGGIVAQVLTPIDAYTELSPMPSGLKGVRVRAATNSVVEML